MGWLDWMEARWGRFAVPRLIPAIIGLNALVYVLDLVRLGMSPGTDESFSQFLTLEMASVLQGEAWRLVTFIFVPPTHNPLFLFFALYVMWIFGEGVEQGMGSFKLNMYYLLGMLGTIAAATVTGWGTSFYLHTSLLFAFATLYPNFQFRLYFILPVEVKWIAWLSLAVIVFMNLRTSLPEKASTIAAFVNYLIFFLPGFLARTKVRVETAERRERFKAASIPESEPLHRCERCGKTEVSDHEAEFRVRDDGREYCSDCLGIVQEAEAALSEKK